MLAKLRWGQIIGDLCANGDRRGGVRGSFVCQCRIPVTWWMRCAPNFAVVRAGVDPIVYRSGTRPELDSLRLLTATRSRSDPGRSSANPDLTEFVARQGFPIGLRCRRRVATAPLPNLVEEPYVGTHHQSHDA
jgi:hypothetical protein